MKNVGVTYSARSSFDLSPNSLAIARARHRESPLLDLTESNPTRASIPYDDAAIRGALALPGSMVYEPEPFGLHAAREAVAREVSAYGPPIDPSRVMLTASTSEAYSFVLKLLCNPGDEVLVPRPSYPLFEHLMRLETAVAVPYRLAYDGAWHLDLPSVRAALSARTRAIVVVSPNNPTGSYLKRDELSALASLGLPVVSDEVFASYAMGDDPKRAPSVLEVEGEGPFFALGGLSKLAGLPQLKVGWIAIGGAADRVESAMSRLEVIADAFLSVGTPVQHGLARLLDSRGIAARAIHARVRANLGWLDSTVKGSAVSVLAVEGGWYAVLRLPKTRSEEAWTLALLEEDGVYVHPGHFFDFEEEAYLVVSLLTPEERLREGTRRILDRVAHEA